MTPVSSKARSTLGKVPATVPLVLHGKKKLVTSLALVVMKAPPSLIA
jgi:hypothetical protein